MSKGRVLLGLSGGVDSSVSALLLKNSGYEVDALFMRNWEEENGSPYCSIKEDFLDAVFVADQLDIEVKELNFSKQYKEKVFSYFLEQLREGKTPNPDILCNREIKFKVFYEYALSLNYDFIATGHYARKRTDNNSFELLKGSDHTKDQSYFLHSIKNEVLEKSLFPLGELEKTKVREIAERNNLITSKKKDSTGICFIGERPFPEFLRNFIPENPGIIYDDKGNEIGRHKGLAFYTLGQRQGLGIGGIKDTQDSPWYVAEKITSDNSIIAVQGNEHPKLFSSVLETKNLFLINNIKDKDFYGTAKVRYRQKDQECKITKKGDTLRIEFSLPQRAVTPGQSVVIYKDDVCLGGGEISEIN